MNIKNIRLKDISSNWFRRDVKYTTKKYTQISLGLLPIRIKRTEHCWEELKKSLVKGYNPEKYGYITILRFFGTNLPIDGNHRLVLLKQLYPEDYTIDVKTTSIITVTITSIILLFLITLFGILNNVNNLIKTVNNFITQSFRF